jgi:hypothetical protein
MAHGHSANQQIHCNLSRAGNRMTRKNGKRIAKSDLPSKVCPVCERPFSWRKKWEKVWEDVKYCSNRCKTASRKA